MATKKAVKTVKAVVSDREKGIIVSLSKQGVETAVIAKAWGIRPQAVAAFKAWDTIRG